MFLQRVEVEAGTCSSLAAIRAVSSSTNWWKIPRLPVKGKNAGKTLQETSNYLYCNGLTGTFGRHGCSCRKRRVSMQRLVGHNYQGGFGSALARGMQHSGAVCGST